MLKQQNEGGKDSDRRIIHPYCSSGVRLSCFSYTIPDPSMIRWKKRFASKWMDSDIYIVIICYFPIFEAINQRGVSRMSNPVPHAFLLLPLR